MESFPILNQLILNQLRFNLLNYNFHMFYHLFLFTFSYCFLPPNFYSITEVFFFSLLFSYLQSLRRSILPLLHHCLVSRMCQSLIVSDSLRPRGLQPARLLYPWDSPGKNTGEGCHSLLQGIFLTQGSNPALLHCR